MCFQVVLTLEKRSEWLWPTVYWGPWRLALLRACFPPNLNTVAETHPDESVLIITDDKCFIWQLPTLSPIHWRSRTSPTGWHVPRAFVSNWTATASHKGLCRLPLRRPALCSAAVDLRRPPRGAPGGDWGTLPRGSWWDTASDGRMCSGTGSVIPSLASPQMLESTESLCGAVSSSWLAEKFL